MTSEEIRKRFKTISASLSSDDRIDLEAKLMIAGYIDIILKTMESRGLSRKELAERIGTSPSFVTQLFRGDKLINFTTLVKIKNVLNIDFKVQLKAPERLDGKRVQRARRVQLAKSLH